MAELVRIFALTGDAVALFTLDGSEPELALEGSRAQCIAVDPRDPRRVYVGTMDSGLWFSVDGGDSWHKAGRSIEEPRVLSVAVSRSHERSGVSVVYAGTEPSNLYRSEDRGLSWNRCQRCTSCRAPGPGRSRRARGRTTCARSRFTRPIPSGSRWGIELGGVMRSPDAGKTWIEHNPEAHSDAQRLLTHPLAPERLYEAAGQGIARSNDRGDTWERLDRGLDRHYTWAEAIRRRPLVRGGQPRAVRRPRERRRAVAAAALARRRLGGG